MESLCEMLAEKLGIVADASSSWLQTAITQYAQMMSIRTTFCAGLSLLLFVSSVAFAISVESIAFVFIALTAFCVAVVYVHDAICWHVTPDSVLIKELTEVLE